MRKYQPIPQIGDCTELPQWYRAGRDGTVWSRRKRGVPTSTTIGKWRQLRASVQKNLGRVTPTVRLVGNSNKPLGKLFSLDVCVCSAFNGPRPDNHIVRHWPDPDPLNCRANNLSWAPRAPRQHPRPPKTARISRPSSHPRRRTVTRNARLHDALVLEIRAAHARGETTKQICEKHGLKYNMVRDVMIGRTWRHVTPADQKDQQPVPYTPRKYSVRAQPAREPESAEPSNEETKRENQT